MILLAPNGSVLRITRSVEEYKSHPLQSEYQTIYTCEVEFMHLCRMDKIYFTKWTDFNIYDTDTADNFIQYLEKEKFMKLSIEKFPNMDHIPLTHMQKYLKSVTGEISQLLQVVEFIKLNKINISNINKYLIE